jgi:acyl dehydratase
MSPKEYRPRGLYFEEFKVGDTMLTPGRTVTEGDISQFCGLAGDYNEVHTNAEYAGETIFGQRMAPGILVAAIASGLATRLALLEGTVSAFVRMDCKFKRPTFIGDTIHMQCQVVQKRETRALGGGMLNLEVEVINQREEVVQEARWTVLMKGRPA